MQRAAGLRARRTAVEHWATNSVRSGTRSHFVQPRATAPSHSTSFTTRVIVCGTEDAVSGCMIGYAEVIHPDGKRPTLISEPGRNQLAERRLHGQVDAFTADQSCRARCAHDCAVADQRFHRLSIQPPRSASAPALLFTVHESRAGREAACGHFRGEPTGRSRLVMQAKSSRWRLRRCSGSPESRERLPCSLHQCLRSVQHH